ncbi:MAG: gamma-glutamyl-gamma-aminobutyrate hydrolase family protein, partial [Candidatus Doudnabacteria bacterium]
ARDRVEELVIKKALVDKKPILGICRGMQIVNVIMGGSLIQELTDVETTEKHMVDPGSSYDDVATFRGQTMDVLQGTRLAKIIGSGSRDVHCAHHQAIDRVAEGLVVNAKSPAGIIEGLESKDKNHYLLLLENHIETQKEKSHEIWESFVKVL